MLRVRVPVSRLDPNGVSYTLGRKPMKIATLAVLAGSIANNAIAKPGKGASKTTVISFTSGNYKCEGVIGPDNLVESARVWLDNPVLGSSPVEAEFTGYQDYKGVKFPSKIVQSQGGF